MLGAMLLASLSTPSTAFAANTHTHTQTHRYQVNEMEREREALELKTMDGRDDNDDFAAME